MLAATATFHAIAEAVVPEAANMNAAQWQAFEQLIEDALAKRPGKVRRQLAIFVRLLNLLSYLRFLRPLRHVSLPQRTQFLEHIQDSGLLLFRRGFWGIRTLIFMGYYARPEAAQLVGYAAAPRGWELRR